MNTAIIGRLISERESPVPWALQVKREDDMVLGLLTQQPTHTASEERTTQMIEWLGQLSLTTWLMISAVVVAVGMGAWIRHSRPPVRKRIARRQATQEELINEALVLDAKMGIRDPAWRGRDLYAATAVVLLIQQMDLVLDELKSINAALSAKEDATPSDSSEVEDTKR